MKLPLLFELDPDRRSTIEDVLRGLSVNERKFLLANSPHLGVRCEAFLASVAPEWFTHHDFLSDDDRDRLAALCSKHLAA